MPRVERGPLNYSGIFYDSANLENFRKWFDSRILGGATTNPVLFEKEGILDVTEHIDKMINISGDDFPISIEIPDTSMTIPEMVTLAGRYAKNYPRNAVIKVPMDPRDPQKAFEVMYKLGQEGIRVNATLGLSMGQLVGASEALRQSKTIEDNYISLFWGRREEAKRQIVEAKVQEREGSVGKSLTDAERNALRGQLEQDIPDAAATLLMTLRYLSDHSLATKIIVGSVRNVSQIEKAFSIGADIVTIPPELLEEWMYTKRGEETADQFNEAYRKVKGKIKLI